MTLTMRDEVADVGRYRPVWRIIRLRVAVSVMTRVNVKVRIGVRVEESVHVTGQDCMGHWTELT